MKKNKFKVLSLILVLLSCFLTILAQTPNPDSLRLKAVRVSEEIKIDGVLNETAWTNAEAIKDFCHRIKP